MAGLNFPKIHTDKFQVNGIHKSRSHLSELLSFSWALISFLIIGCEGVHNLMGCHLPFRLACTVTLCRHLPVITTLLQDCTGGAVTTQPQQATLREKSRHKCWNPRPKTKAARASVSPLSNPGSPTELG